MKHLMLRVPDDLHHGLREERDRTDKSINQTVIDLLRQALSFGRKPSNGLGQLGGRWDEEEFREFEEAIGFLERVDPVTG